MFFVPSPYLSGETSDSTPDVTNNQITIQVENNRNSLYNGETRNDARDEKWKIESLSNDDNNGIGRQLSTIPFFIVANDSIICTMKKKKESWTRVEMWVGDLVISFYLFFLRKKLPPWFCGYHHQTVCDGPSGKIQQWGIFLSSSSCE